MITAILWICSKIIQSSIPIRYSIEDTAYDYCEEIAYINVFDLIDCGFLRHISTNHRYTDVYKYSLLSWSILHELGHYYTDYEDDDLDTRMLCSVISKEDAQQNPLLQDIYFNLDSEYAATEWAIEYVQSHPCRVKILDVFLNIFY